MIFARISVIKASRKTQSFKIQLFNVLLQPSSSDNAAIKLDDFELLRVIGRGSYAKVLMVEQRRTKRIYAMKVIKKGTGEWWWGNLSYMYVCWILRTYFGQEGASFLIKTWK